MRWGTALHDSFMLPHFVWADFADVIADLNANGFAFDAEWFRPHWAFRFPLAGKVQYGGVASRTAPGAGTLERHGRGGNRRGNGTFRWTVRSKRLEVKAKGLVAGRHKILVNGRAVPLKPVSLDEHVGGVRFPRPGSR